MAQLLLVRQRALGVLDLDRNLSCLFFAQACLPLIFLNAQSGSRTFLRQAKRTCFGSSMLDFNLSMRRLVYISSQARTLEQNLRKNLPSIDQYSTSSIYHRIILIKSVGIIAPYDSRANPATNVFLRSMLSSWESHMVNEYTFIFQLFPFLLHKSGLAQNGAGFVRVQVMKHLSIHGAVHRRHRVAIVLTQTVDHESTASTGCIL